MKFSIQAFVNSLKSKFTKRLPSENMTVQDLIDVLDNTLTTSERERLYGGCVVIDEELDEPLQCLTK